MSRAVAHVTKKRLTVTLTEANLLRGIGLMRAEIAYSYNGIAKSFDFYRRPDNGQNALEQGLDTVDN